MPGEYAVRMAVWFPTAGGTCYEVLCDNVGCSFIGPFIRDPLAGLHGVPVTGSKQYR